KHSILLLYVVGSGSRQSFVWRGRRALEASTRKMRISQILDKIDENQLFVPAFQREYVWNRENAKELIASLIKHHPTGTMLTWEANDPPERKGSWVYDPKQGAVRLILDGQQRITTLYMLIRGELPPYYK